MERSGRRAGGNECPPSLGGKIAGLAGGGFAADGPGAAACGLVAAGGKALGREMGPSGDALASRVRRWEVEAGSGEWAARAGQEREEGVG